jgi:hypothetical protein
MKVDLDIGGSSQPEERIVVRLGKVVQPGDCSSD